MITKENIVKNCIQSEEPGACIKYCYCCKKDLVEQHFMVIGKEYFNHQHIFKNSGFSQIRNRREMILVCLDCWKRNAGKDWVFED